MHIRAEEHHLILKWTIEIQQAIYSDWGFLFPSTIKFDEWTKMKFLGWNWTIFVDSLTLKIMMTEPNFVNYDDWTDK